MKPFYTWLEETFGEVSVQEHAEALCLPVAQTLNYLTKQWVEQESSDRLKTVGIQLSAALVERDAAVRSAQREAAFVSRIRSRLGGDSDLDTEHLAMAVVAERDKAIEKLNQPCPCFTPLRG